MFDFLRRGSSRTPGTSASAASAPGPAACRHAAFGSSTAESAAPTTAAPIAVVAPATGRLLPLEEVPDPVFSRGLVGPGFAVEPTSGTITAPIDGTVVTLPDSLHAVGIRHCTGVEVLVHVGVDTVTLKGEGFRALCSEGQEVRSGDPLLEVDLEVVTAKVPSIITPVIVTDAAGSVLSAPDLHAAPGAAVLTLAPS